MHWLANLLSQANKIRLGKDAVMLDDLQKMLRDGRSSQRAYQRTMLGPEFPGADAEAPGDDVIRIDSPDQHYHGPAQSTLGTLAKLALGAGLIATGVGVPAGAWLLYSALKDRVPAAVPTPQPPATQPTPSAQATPQPPVTKSVKWVLDIPPPTQ